MENTTSTAPVDRPVRHLVSVYASINQRGPHAFWCPLMKAMELPFIPRIGECIAIANKDQGHLSGMCVKAITYFSDGEVIIEVDGEDWDEQEEDDGHADLVLEYWRELGFEERMPR